MNRLVPWALLLLASCTSFQPAVPGSVAPKKAPPEMPRIPDPSAEAAEVPAGYRAEVVVTDLTYPTSLEFDDAGSIYIAEAGCVYGDASAPARVLRISPSGEVEVLTDQLSGPVTDLLWHDGRLFISHRGKISVVDGERVVRDLVTHLPSYGDHFNNQMTVGPDRKIYFGQGTATNSGVVGVDNFLFLWLPKHPDVHDLPARDITLTGESFPTLNPMILGSPEAPKIVTTRAFRPFGERAANDNKVQGVLKANGTILRMNADGSDLEVYAWGLRNPFGVLWALDGKLYVADNGYDERGSRPIANAPDFVWTVREGGWYGFPDFVGGVPVSEPRFRPRHGPQPRFLMHEHPPVERPFVTRPVHAAVTKLDASPGSSFGFEGQLFMGEAGDLTPLTGPPEEHSGFQVVRIDPATGLVLPFFYARRSTLGPPGLEYVATAGPKRPIDVRFSPDGKALYVVDLGAFAVLETTVPLPAPLEGTGAVWRITRTQVDDLSPPAGLSLKPGARPARAK